MNVREAVPEDGEALTHLLAELGYPDTAPFIQNRIRTLSNASDSGILVCDHQNTVVGFLAYHLFVQLGLQGGFCRIAYFCVDERYRGQGIGEELEAVVVQIANKNGCDRLEVHCSESRTQAHEFYRRLGYAESPKYFTKSLVASRPDGDS